MKLITYYCDMCGRKEDEKHVSDIIFKGEDEFEKNLCNHCYVNLYSFSDCIRDLYSQERQEDIKIINKMIYNYKDHSFKEIIKEEVIS